MQSNIEKAIEYFTIETEKRDARAVILELINTLGNAGEIKEFMQAVKNLIKNS
jgi:hypothetical protein